MDVPQARRIARPRWVNARTLLGLLLFSGAWMGSQALINQAEHGFTVWGAARDLGEGTRVAEDDLSAITVRLPGDVASRYAPTTLSLTGSVVARPIRAGELIAREWIVAGAEEALTARLISVPLSQENPVVPELRPGDRVDVYATFDSQDVRARTTLLVRAAEIAEVMTSGGLVVEDEALVGVTLGVSPEEAARLAFAIRTGELDLVKVIGPVGHAGSKTIRFRDFP